MSTFDAAVTLSEQEIIDEVVDRVYRISARPFGSPFQDIFDDSGELSARALVWLRRQSTIIPLMDKARICGRALNTHEVPYGNDLLSQMDGALPDLFGNDRTTVLRATRRPSEEEIDTLVRQWAQQSLRNGGGSWYGIAELHHSDGRTAWALIEIDGDGNPELSMLEASRAEVMSYLIYHFYLTAPIPAS